MPETYLLPSEAALSLRVSVKTLQQWRWQGKGPPYLRVAGGRIRYVARDLETWMAAQAVRPQGEHAPRHTLRAEVLKLPPARR